MLEKQFEKTARSITPPPSIDTTNWAKPNISMIRLEKTAPPPRIAGPAKDRNLVGSDSALLSTKLTFHAANGGEEAVHEMFQSMMDSGQFNEQILAYARALQNATLPNTKTTLRVVGTGDKIAGMHAVEDGNRATAETSRTLE